MMHCRNWKTVTSSQIPRSDRKTRITRSSIFVISVLWQSAVFIRSPHEETSRQMTVVPMAIKAQACTSCNCPFKQDCKQTSMLFVTLSFRQESTTWLYLPTREHLGRRVGVAVLTQPDADTAMLTHVCVCARMCVH